jgi:hypothetical protein
MDIMEAVDSEPLLDHGNMHGPISPGSPTSSNLTAIAPATTNELFTSFYRRSSRTPGTVSFFLVLTPLQPDSLEPRMIRGAS